MELESRLELAQAFLQEAVFRSRAAQAAGTFLAQSAAAADRQCGLGQGAEVVLDLSERARELFPRLFPDTCDRAAIDAVMRAWVEQQDSLDRDRNHFLKAFRRAHGFDRSAYSPARLQEFESGLERINQTASTAHRAAAERLLSLSRSPTG